MVEHRANPGTTVEQTKESGYLTEDYVIGLATAARRGLPALVLAPEELGRRAPLPSSADLSRAYPELHHLAASPGEARLRCVRWDDAEDFRTRFRAGKYDNQITAIYHLGACSSTRTAPMEIVNVRHSVSP